jgi:hypothetical protein
MRKLVIIDSENAVEKIRTLIFEQEEFTAKWTQKIEDDLRDKEGLDVSVELSYQLLQTIRDKYNLTDEELDYCDKVIHGS